LGYVPIKFWRELLQTAKNESSLPARLTLLRLLLIWITSKEREEGLNLCLPLANLKQRLKSRTKKCPSVALLYLRNLRIVNEKREKKLRQNNQMAPPSSFFHKPELALRRAIELQGINQEEAALELLHDVLSSRRHRTWSPVYEQIMMHYLDLCLQQRKSREAKDGLHQYRNLAQSQAPGSLEKVILYLINKAEAACTEAKAYVDAEQLVETAEEEDFGASPQAILLSTMSTDPSKSQRDAALLMPSLKFLWETYRAVLDILRSNSKLEHVYHQAAQGALRFCRVYHRRMEFRHLCDMLRMHLGNLRQFGSVTEDDGRSGNKVC
jgi:hypothetical protein